jgi:hypothetical protein
VNLAWTAAAVRGSPPPVIVLHRWVLAVPGVEWCLRGSEAVEGLASTSLVWMLWCQRSIFPVVVGDRILLNR